ncbi:TPA: hypothetical protein ACOXWE_004550 [Salmonella enterica]
MTNTNEVTRQGGIVQDSCPNKELNAVAELHACNASDQPGNSLEKGRRLAPAARKTADAISMTRSSMNSKSGQRVKVSVIHVDKHEAVSLTNSRHTPANITGSVITSSGLTCQHREAS